eukprot:UN00488
MSIMLILFLNLVLVLSILIEGNQPYHRHINSRWLILIRKCPLKMLIHLGISYLIQGHRRCCIMVKMLLCLGRQDFQKLYCPIAETLR